jgi:anti-anti-sigma regulatory factor
MDSAGAHAVIDAQTTAYRRGLDLILHAPQRPVMRVFEVLRLTDLLHIEGDGSGPE